MSDDQQRIPDEFTNLLAIIDRLRSPGGCPWDREQSETSMAPHLLEEAFEAVEALQSGDAEASTEELGDVLMNVLMIARIASETGRFDLGRVSRTIADKLVRRHPHVFGDVDAEDSDQVLANWEQIKLDEKPERSRGVLDGLPAALPALLKAFRIGEKAGRVGFDWPSSDGPRAKITEELDELDAATARGDQDAVASEVGDLLFAVANYARHLGVNPEIALGGTITRFRGRFEHIERRFGSRLGDVELGDLEAAWQEAKRIERSGGGTPTDRRQ